jgi:hypothetical protein
MESWSLPPLDVNALLKLGPTSKLHHGHGPIARQQSSPLGMLHCPSGVRSVHCGVPLNGGPKPCKNMIFGMDNQH